MACAATSAVVRKQASATTAIATPRYAFLFIADSGVASSVTILDLERGKAIRLNPDEAR